MARSTTLSLIVLLILSCQERPKKQEQFKLPPSDYMVLKYKPEWYWVFEDASPSDLSNEELVQIEEILQSAIANHNNHYKDDPEAFEQWGLELDKYKRQYVPVINQKGEKVIWMNFFCKNSNIKNQENEILLVLDGGNCYFNLKINLTTKQYSNLEVNGYA